MSLKYFPRTAICAAIISLSAAAANAQTQVGATWIGSSGDEWNTGPDWSTAAPPGNDANATTNAWINVGTTVNYNLPMTATSFGTLTNYGILNINTNGFTCNGIYTTLPGSTIDAVNITNNGSVVTSYGAFALGTNGQATVANGASLTAFSLGVAFGGTSHTAGTSTFTNSGGFVNVNSTSISGAGNTGTGRLIISGGTNNLGKTSVGRYASASASTLGTEGLAIYGGQVTMTNLSVSAGSYGTAYIDGGTVTNYGNVTINGTTAGRYLRVIQSAGLFVVPDPSLIYENLTTAGTETARYQVLGGTNIIGGIYIGTSNSATAGTGTVTISATVYIGSQGIATNGAVLDTITLNSSGLLGATANWTGSANMILGSGLFTFLAADPSGNPNNITLINPLTSTGGILKSGGGTLTLSAANTYSGSTIINAGTLALGAGGSLVSPTIVIGPGTTFDVSALSGNYSPVALQTISGFGTINGLITGTNGTLQPGSNTVTGTLTFNSGLTELGGVQNNFVLSANPAGPNNDLMTVTGNLTLGGTNTITVSGSLPNNANYTLIQYSGSLSGGTTNFVLAGVIGYLTNTANAIVLHTLATTRGPTNVTWIGNSVNNNWDAATTTNWLNAGNLDYFISGDTALFSNAGGKNSQVNLVGSLSPANIVINTASNYVFSGSGSIVNGTLTVSNGMVSILTANTYNAPTVLAGGVLATPSLANSGNASGIGAASADPANVLFNGGTLYYYGTSVGTDHGMTFTNSGGTIDVTNGTTLTLNGTLAGPAGFTKIDTGSLTLPNANTYTGNTVLSNGTLTLNNAAAAGTGTINLYGGNLAIGAVKPANTINAVGNAQITGGNSGGATGIKNVTGNGNILLAVTASAGVFDLTGDMSTYGGTITISNAGGTFVRLNGSTTSDGSALATWNLGNGPMDLNIRTSCPLNNFGALQGGSSTTLSGRGGSANNGPTTHSIGANNLSTEFDGIIQNGNGGGSSTTSITKVGTGTLTLGGNNTYSGTTTLSSGAVLFNGSNSGSGSINVQSSGTLGGSGTLAGTVNVDGTLQPGFGISPAVATLTINNTINLNSDGTNIMRVSHNSATSDKISGNNTVNFGGTLTVVTNAGDAPFALGDSFTLYSVSSYSGNFAVTNLPALAAGLVWNWDPTTGILSVVSAVTSGPTVTASVSGSVLTLSWPSGNTGWYLQAQTNSLSTGLNTNWVDVGGSSSVNSVNVTIDPTKPTVFYRLSQNP
jgi:autotransporter-associated beta strand protein